MKKRLIAIVLALMVGLGIPVHGVELAEIPEAGGYDDPMYWRETQEPEEGTIYAERRAGSVSYADFTPRSWDGERVLCGIDVSEYQEEIDWAAVAESGVEFAFIRVGVRGWGYAGTLMRDSDYWKNLQGARANGIAVGAYMFSQAVNEDEAIEEARHVMALLDGYELDLPLVLDFEYASVPGGLGGRLYNADLTPEEATAVCNAFCAEVERCGYESMVYANRNMLENDLLAEKLGRVWLAHYTDETSYAGDYDYWQCTSSGAVSGISGPVDLDFGFVPDGGGLPFRDVARNSWYYDRVKAAYELGIVNGKTPTKFDPEGVTSRCQMVAMLYRMREYPASSGSVTFADVPSDAYYWDALRWAVESGFVTGYDSRSFGPENPIRREELVTILYRVAGSPPASGDLSGYGDGQQVSSWAVDAVRWAVENGLMRGYADGTLRPKKSTPRSEACALIMRFLEQGF